MEGLMMKAAAAASAWTLIGMWLVTVTPFAAPATGYSSEERDKILGSNGYLIDRLDKRIEELKKRLDEDVVDYNEIMKHLESDLDRIEATGCEEGEFQCGGVGRECLTDLLVCDGVTDCHNGKDEDPSYCDVSKINAGASYSGWYVEGKCGKSPRNTLFCRMVITSVVRKKFFKPFLYLGVRSTCNFTRGEEGKPELKTYKFKAVYHAANRHWRSEGGGYHADCHFTDGTFDILRCDMFASDSKSCAEGILSYRDK